ncbi:putative glycosyltransferase EpsJ [Paenibacillus konkukensis]|uniref:Glycosyltransferase EpsJ n=1 Tax=Paenibacillus konkukensis TaxID=2020716 RepID=A0ABY4RUH7_9BACL|nr:glycosyltransferase [Paenibacillus konkukensis]UQZ85697.1 putative glycosyltransferase EpsJ [Paenibacillus konkukensis]
MKPKVSIVVPIYNMEAYLERCLDALLTQTLTAIEIIAVNDGSTDRSGHILDRYARQDKRIIAIHKKNGGVSSARNEGMRAASGEFIGFVDPDDWVDGHMYETLYEQAVSEDADIVMCTYIREFGTHAKEKMFQLPEKVSYDGQEVRDHLLRRLIGPLNEEIASPELLDAWGTVWSKLYRADLLQRNGLSFVDLKIVGTNEDSLFNIHACYHARKFVFINKPFYHYWRVNDSSVTTGYKPDLKEQWFSLYQFMEDFIEANGLPSEYRQALHNRICLNTLGLGLNTISPGNKAPAYKKVQKLSAILRDRRIRQSFSRFETGRCSHVWRIFYSFAKFRFAIGYYLMLLAVERLRKIAR